MSDFDKEAERERLREKYEQDQKKREASERMSDLLLKGATMTNAHCNNCGDPIFRYDGDEFCPTCQQVVTEDEAAEAAAGEEATDAPTGEQTHSADETATDQTAPETGTQELDAANGTAPEGGSSDHIEIKQPDGPTAQTGSDQAAGTATDRPADPASAQNQPRARQPADPSEETREQTGSSAGEGQASPSAYPSPTQQTSGSAPSTSSSDAGGDFEAAHASLVRTLRSHAEQAEQCDDPRRARDHLAAAREAAEALTALSGSY